MSDVLQFLLLGLGVGAVYTLAAQGIVLISRGSGVLNFAQGGFAIIGAYAYVAADGAGLPLLVAIGYGVALAAVAGALCQVLVMYPLRNASPLARLVATLGILAVIRQTALLRYEDKLQLIPSILPSELWTPFEGVRISSDRLWLAVVAVVLTAVLWIVYRFTKFGLATEAVAENTRTAAAIGVSPNRVAVINWSAGAALGGLAGVLLVPIVGLSVNNLALLALPALAAALLGGFRSFPLTLAGAMLIGVGESELARFGTGVPGLAKSVPFVLVILVLLIRPPQTTNRTQLVERRPAVGTGLIRWPWVSVAVLGAGTLTLLAGASWANAITVSVVAACVGLSLVVVTGYTGQLSLAQYALAGVGALVAARLSQDQGWPFLLCLLAALIVAVPLGALLGLPALRTTGVNLSVVTLGFSVVIEQMVLTNPDYTGGIAGTVVSTPDIFGWNIDPILHPGRYALVAVLIFAVLAIAIANLRRGRSGRRMIAVRDNERAAASLGIDITRTKLFAFCIASALAAVGGVLIGFTARAVTYTQFDINGSINAVVATVIGGIGFILGPLLGAAIAGNGVGAEVMDRLLSGWSDYLPLVAGVAVILNLIGTPDGVVGEMSRLLHRGLSRVGLLGRTPEPQVSPGELVERPSPKGLAVRDLTVRFGGLIALDSVSFTVRPGEVVGLVGPNGAGKTTVIDAITGLTRRYKGSILVGDEPVDRLSANRRSLVGVGRSFQALELFEDMTVYDNLRAAQDKARRSWALWDLFRVSDAPLYGAGAAAVEEFDLAADLGKKPGELSYGRRRLVGIARAVAGRPSVLLLDEPAAGLDRAESQELAALVRRLADEWQMAVVLVEHDVEMVMSISDRVVALDFGRKIADGIPSEVRNDRAVIDAFLGEDTAAVPS